MKEESYITAIVKKLKCSTPKRKEIKKNLEADIAEAMKKGETMEDIVKRMGSAPEVAAEFNANFSEQEKKLYKRGTCQKTIGIVAGVLILLVILGWYALPKGYSLEEKGNFQKEELIHTAKTAVAYFSAQDDEALAQMCSREEMADAITGENGQEIRAMFSEDWGEPASYGNPYTAEIVQFGTSVGVVQMTVAYEDFSATYTISVDKNGKLAGFYIK